MRPATYTLLFDFGGTLDADGVAWKERFHGHYCSEGLELGSDAFAPIFYAADDRLVGTTDRESDLGHTVRRLVDNLESELGSGTHTDGRRERVAQRFLDQTEAALRRNRPVLEALRERHRLGIVSNFYGNLPAVCRSADLGELFDVIVDSEQVGARKPDLAIFHAALGPLNASPEGAVLVGDSLHRDRLGARRCGMRFIWIASPEAQQVRLAAEGPADHPIIERLDQLADMLL